ncbi:MAG: four helix bundle protein [Cyanobacteria bacterium J06621_8]
MVDEHSISIQERSRLFAVGISSNADFISKYSIALKEASETRYWMRIMIESEII